MSPFASRSRRTTLAHIEINGPPPPERCDPTQPNKTPKAKSRAFAVRVPRAAVGRRAGHVALAGSGGVGAGGVARGKRCANSRASGCSVTARPSVPRCPVDGMINGWEQLHEFCHRGSCSVWHLVAAQTARRPSPQTPRHKRDSNHSAVQRRCPVCGMRASTTRSGRAA